MSRRLSGLQRLLPIIGLLPTLLLGAVAKADHDAAELIAVIDAVETGWEQADGTPFIQHFLDFPGARYIESGGRMKD